MSDWSEAEYKQILNAQVPKFIGERVIPNAVANAVDWVTAGAVNAIKD